MNWDENDLLLIELKYALTFLGDYDYVFGAAATSKVTADQMCRWASVQAERAMRPLKDAVYDDVLGRLVMRSQAWTKQS